VSRSEALTVQAGDAILAGTLTLPDAPAHDPRGRHPAALLLPSWLPRTREGSWDPERHPGWFAVADDPTAGILARLAEALARQGVASLRCDPRGSGASEGAWEETSLFTRIDDARDMLAAMRSHGALDLRRTAIVGHGEGATLALSVAIGDPAVSALTLIGPSARSWRDVLRRGVAERSRTGADLEHPIVRAIDRLSEEILERAERREAAMPIWIRGTGVVQLQLAGIEQAIHTPALALATMLHRSVAILHGADDAWSHPDEGQLLAAALSEGGNAVGLRVVSGAGHDLADAADAVIEEAAADLASRITAVELPPVLVALEEMDGGVR
jgi:alpha-beta hydrolase superfamily lysophospholipase